MFDPVHDKLCPIFKLGTIIKSAGEDFNKIAYEVKWHKFYKNFMIVITINLP